LRITQHKCAFHRAIRKNHDVDPMLNPILEVA
jgi:hypothetical protein